MVQDEYQDITNSASSELKFIIILTVIITTIVTLEKGNIRMECPRVSVKNSKVATTIPEAERMIAVGIMTGMIVATMTAAGTMTTDEIDAVKTIGGTINALFLCLPPGTRHPGVFFPELQ